MRRCSYRGRRTSKHHDRAAGSMSAMRPGEPADEPFLRVVRRSAEEQRATCHAPGAQPRPDRSRMALQARSRGQGASGGCGGPGRRGRPLLATTQDRHRRAVLVACCPRCWFRLARYLVSQSLEEVLLQAWEDSHGLVVARREVRSFVTTGLTGRRR